MRNHFRQAKPRPPCCLNCGMEVSARYCGGCGQENTHKAVSFGEIVRDFCDEFVRIDSKVLRTLFLLLFRPGVLTRQYVNGKRIRYIAPFKMYLTISAIFLLLLPRLSTLQGSFFETGTEKKGRIQFHATASEKERGLDSGTVELPGATINLRTLPKTVALYTAQQSHLPKEKRDSPYLQFVTKKVINIVANPKEAGRDFAFSTIPNTMFFMLPIFALLLKATYAGSRRFYIEHLIFALHSHTLLFLVLSLVLIADAATTHAQTAGILTVAVASLVLSYFLSLRRVYEQGWRKTIWKACLLFLGYQFLLCFALLFGLLVTLLVTFLTP